METTIDTKNKDGTITRTYTRVHVLTPEEYQAEIAFKESNLSMMEITKQNLIQEISTAKSIALEANPLQEEIGVDKEIVGIEEKVV